MKTCPLLLMLCPRRKCLACNEAFLNESAFQDHKLSMRHKRNFYAYFFKEHRYVIDIIRKISKMGLSINDATHFLKFLTPSWVTSCICTKLCQMTKSTFFLHLQKFNFIDWFVNDCKIRLRVGTVWNEVLVKLNRLQSEFVSSIQFFQVLLILCYFLPW